MIIIIMNIVHIILIDFSTEKCFNPTVVSVKLL